MELVRDYERIDDLHRNGLLVIQDKKKFCFGIDAVLLSDFAIAKKGEHVLDIGTGTGVIPILMTAKSEAQSYTAIDIQLESVEMSTRSVKLNKLEHLIDVVQCDIKEALTKFKPASFDVITTNPPYVKSGGGLLNETSPKAIARHEISCTLLDIVAMSAKLLKTNGRIYMVHRPYRLADILVTMREYNIEPKLIRFVHSNATKEPSLLLIEGVKNANSMVKILPPLIIYKSDGSYTDEIRQIYYEEARK